MKKILLSFIRIYEGIRRRYSRLYHNILLKRLGRNCQIDYTAYMPGKQNISIGNNCVINRGVIIQSCESAEVILGDEVTLSYGVMILTGGLDYRALEVRRRHVASGVVVGDRTWIGANAIILPGVEVGHDAVIAAGSVVNKNVDDFSLVGGIPAKKIRSLGPREQDD